MKIRTRIFIYGFLSTALIIIGMSLIGDYWLLRYHLRHGIKSGEQVARMVVLESVGLILTDDRIRLRNLYQSAIKANYNVAYLFTEEDNEILAHTFEEGVPRGLLNLGEFPLQSNLDVIPIESEDGLTFYHIRLKVGKLSSAVLHLGLSGQRINEDIVPFRRAMFVVGCLMLIVVPFTVASFLARIISRPIHILNYGSKRIGNGELDYRLNIKTGDEIEQLADEFNRMAAKLEVNYATLEQKVVERTESLQNEINERKKALDELERHQQMLEVSERNLKEFSGKILSVREEEKKKLSSSLHDEVGSMTVALGSVLSITEEEMKDNNVQGALDGINRTKRELKKSVEKLKNISIDLRPPDLDIVGLPSVLRQYFSTIGKQARIRIDFSVRVDERSLSDEMAIALYRVSQEALNNIVKHAKAGKVKIRLYFQGNDIKLTIRDDGKGFKVEDGLQKTNGFGIRGMKERIESLGGTFSIKSTPQKGTEISTTIPMIKEHN
jgi:signal transduction histidine kinase